MNLLMSIKTIYANKIFNDLKHFEYRTKSIGEKNINKKIYIYSSKDEKAIIGYIVVDKILEGSVDYIINYTTDFTEGTKEYFKNRDKCYALHISKYYKFKNPISIEILKNNFDNFVIPQFFRYIKVEEEKFINEYKNNDI